MTREVAFLQALEMYQGRGLNEDQAQELWKKCILDPELFELMQMYFFLRGYFIKG